MQNNEFEMYYQPQVSLKEQRIIGVEALIRWHHPDHGLLNPGHFIDVAEETGLICAISDWVIDQACAQHQQWQAAGVKDLTLCSDISAREFERDDMVSRIVDATKRHGIKKGGLELEITETLLMNDAERVIEKVRELRKRGIRISIDDFGTRYSSLNYLRRFSVNTIKIDQSFVRDLQVDNGSTAIVHAVLGIAEGFGLHVLAEGVETRQQMETLRGMGCDEMQGYLFSRPLPASELTAKLVAGGLPIF